MLPRCNVLIFWGILYHSLFGLLSIPNKSPDPIDLIGQGVVLGFGHCGH
jgi:hypothetical protein